MDRAVIQALKFDEQGLIPAIVQDWRDGTVLMVAYMNPEALEKTVATGIAHFWSRSRNQLWEKGATSGHRLRVKDLFFDCDKDTLLVTVTPDGPACHTGETSCFFHRLEDLTESCEGTQPTAEARGTIFDRLYDTILQRKQAGNAESYVASLFTKGQDKILKKVSEEAGEVLLASKGGKRDEIIHEAADLMFHLLVTLGYHEIPPREVFLELAKRFGKSGFEEKASRSKQT
jgi:phosphoribosyl-AMP cyclohydrolase / phosphoribosyl-ATP pyrophosphohydrolase